MEKLDRLIPDFWTLDPETLIQWLDQGSASLPSNLSVVAQAASLRARRNLDVQWLRVANRAYSALASRESERQARLYERSAMTLRGFLLAKLGELPGEPLLNISEIVRWFREVTPVSPEEALDLAHQPRSRGAKIALQLRDIKNDLGVFESLEGSALLNGYPDIVEWLRIRKTLP
jgi:hypothetical protein